MIEVRGLTKTYGAERAVDPDGERFVVVSIAADIRQNRLHVVTNWFEELKRLAPLHN